MTTKKVEKQFCQWHETMETPAECSMKPTVETKPTHTPTPWTLKTLELMPGVNGKIAKEDAAFIVRAVNAHATLIGALEKAIRYLEHDEVAKIPFAVRSDVFAQQIREILVNFVEEKQ